MAGTLVRKIAGLASAGYGINILEEQPPGMVVGVNTTTIAVVAELPWGPEDVVTDIGSAADLFGVFAPAPFDANADYDALNAFTNVRFPGPVKVVRVGATSAAKADLGAITAGTGDITITAKYNGDVGNDITYAIAAGTSSGKKLTIAIGTGYSAEYDNLDASAGDFSAIDDAYVDITDDAPTADPANTAATNLTGGSDGTAVAGDYVGSLGTNKGIQLYAAEAQDFAVLYVASCPESLKDSVNDGLEAFVNDYDKGIVVYSTVDGQSASAAESYAAARRSDRAVYPWPRVKMTDRFDSALAVIEYDGAHFAAVAIASVNPEDSPGGANGAQFLTGISDLETFATTTELDSLKAAGVSCWFIDRTLGAIIRGAVTTSITSGLTKVFRRRMTDFLQDSLAAALVRYAETRLDVDLATQSLGNNTAGAVGEMTSFLEGLTPGRIRAYGVDAFSENTVDDINAGRWTILTAAQLYGSSDGIILKTNIGESVVVTAA